jgi:hypothetical protein
VKVFENWGVSAKAHKLRGVSEVSKKKKKLCCFIETEMERHKNFSNPNSIE